MLQRGLQHTRRAAQTTECAVPGIYFVPGTLAVKTLQKPCCTPPPPYTPGAQVCCHEYPAS
jgi:hypothetical protein